MFFSDTDSQFQLLSVTEYKNTTPQQNLEKCMDFDTLSFRLQGHAEYRIFENSFSLNTNDLMFLPSNTPYSLCSENEHLIVFHFETTGSQSHSAACYTPKNPAVFKPIFESALKTWFARRPGYYQKTMSFFFDILAQMHAQFDPAFNSASYFRIKDALDYLHLNYRDSSLSVEQLCQISNLSDTQFRKCFREVYGTTPLNQINRLRTDYAADLLNGTSHSVEYIAEESGFTDAKYFSYVFKKYRSKSPSAQRQGK